MKRDSTTKLRICGNSSFKTNSKSPSLNNCQIPGPNYLNSIEGILLRWRAGHNVAHTDIRDCYHKIASNKKDISLHRTFIKPKGEEYWKEACFAVVRFGDELRGATA